MKTALHKMKEMLRWIGINYLSSESATLVACGFFLKENGVNHVANG